MKPEFDPELPAEGEGEAREGLRRALEDSANGGFQARLRSSFVRGDFSSLAASRGPAGGRSPAAAGDPALTNGPLGFAAGSEGSNIEQEPERGSAATRPRANPPSAIPHDSVAHDNLPGGALAGGAPEPQDRQPSSGSEGAGEARSDGRSPWELRLAAALRPGPAPEALRVETRAAFVGGAAAEDLAPLERQALREALGTPAPRKDFARDLRAEFLGVQAAGAGSSVTGPNSTPVPARAERTRAAGEHAAQGARVLLDPRLAGARWMVTALAAAAALLLWFGPFGESSDGWKIRDRAQLGDLATFNGRPVESDTLPADGHCEFCPGVDTVLSYRGSVHLGLDGETQAVLDRPRKGEMLGMRFSTPTGEANLVAIEGALPTRIATGQVEVVVAEGATSVRYRKEGTCVVVVEGEAQVTLLAGFGESGEPRQRTWKVSRGQRLTVDAEGRVAVFDDFTEQCEIDPHAAERLADMRYLQQSLSQGRAL
jgi:hypothetical protein